jgi:hypothetical protein
MIGGQGDQIGRFFLIESLLTYGRIFENEQSSQNLWVFSFLVLILRKIEWATFRALFHKPI